jgi:hypothetical protein
MLKFHMIYPRLRTLIVAMLAFALALAAGLALGRMASAAFLGRPAQAMDAPLPGRGTVTDSGSGPRDARS